MEKLKILVTGSNGFIGQKLLDLFSQEAGVDLLAVSRGPDRYRGTKNYRYRSADVLERQVLEALVLDFNPDCVIHTVALAQVDTCEREQERCRAVNVESVQHFIRIGARCDFHFVFLSTDFVFDGRHAPYTELDPPAPLNAYGKSKADAEALLLESGLKCSIIRTILVYGLPHDPQRSNLVQWVRRSLESGQRIQVVSDQFRMPTLAEDLAWCIWAVCKKGPQGLLHLSGQEYLSVYEIALRVAAFWKLDASLITPVPSSSLPEAAPRPACSGFVLDKAERNLGFRPHSLEQGFELMQKLSGNKPYI